MDLLKSYVDQYGDKTCAYDDLMLYTVDLEGEALKVWVEYLEGSEYDYVRLFSLVFRLSPLSSNLPFTNHLITPIRAQLLKPPVR